MVFEFAMWTILMGGKLYLKRWKTQHAELESGLYIGEADEASSTELEYQTIKVDTDKSGGKVGATRPM